MTSPVTTTAGKVSGAFDESIGVYRFKGIPFAASPVGELRWKAPQPAPRWSGVRQALRFGPRAMQLPVFGDMNFRSDGMSEDCLYLNSSMTGSIKTSHLLHKCKPNDGDSDAHTNHPAL